MDGETYKEFSENDTKHSLFHLSDDEFSIFLDRSKKVYCTKHLLMISAMETAGKDWDEIVAVVIDKMLECQRP
jgi:TPP-dependent 2-oxoacid decarboxylase